MFFEPLFFLTNVDEGRIDHILEMRRVVFLDHLDAGAAVLGDLIDISSLQKTETNVTVPQTVGRAGFAIPVEF